MHLKQDYMRKEMVSHVGRFINSEGHPGFKILRNNALIIAIALGMDVFLQDLQVKHQVQAKGANELYWSFWSS